jgi:hypothetical protein
VLDSASDPAHGLPAWSVSALPAWASIVLRAEMALPRASSEPDEVGRWVSGQAP